ncbi:homoserine dehydrogenase [Actinomyces sp. S4-C9]|uniref:homoserine dehydrogenase n=1 Tax=Actinomyces sp. S4-C9 TaxID=1219581 RepID=UPI00050FA6C1|nr:homoserine dehydrogenase [Actinomyces sp. S4-C9]KGF02658.1 homoserine dehydrogenase [Actinomyces sp. S4-C9]
MSSVQKIAVLGAGTVGSQVIRLIEEHQADLAARAGARLQVQSVLVRDVNAKRDFEVDPALLTTDANEAIDGADIVIELIGSIEPAFTYVKRALGNGSTVITGNKALLAQHGAELYELAEQNDTDLYYEAAVAGAIPIVYGLRESIAGDRVNRLVGIVNGTTNFILDQMTTTGATYEDALARAQELGFAEADPTADVEGLDAAAKCSIMASLAFHTRVSMADVKAQGISSITAEDIAQAAKSDMVIKLIAVAEHSSATGEEGITAAVYPALIPVSHPLATVSGAFNAILLDNESAGRLMFYGQGAGGAPTASAVLSDLVAGASHRVLGGHAPRESRYAKLPILSPGTASSRFQVSLLVADRPGVLAEVAGVFGQSGISLITVSQEMTKPGEATRVTLSTSATSGKSMDDVLAKLRDLPVVVEVASVFRIEGEA